MTKKPIAFEFCQGPYGDTGAHLRDELTRVDLLVRAQVERWRLTIGAAKPDNLWGVLYVSDTEIDQYLETCAGASQELARPVFESVSRFWQAEEALRSLISQRLDLTAPAVELRLERLRTRLQLAPAEVDVLLLCLLPELEWRYRRIFGYLQDDASRSCAPPTCSDRWSTARRPRWKQNAGSSSPGATF